MNSKPEILAPSDEDDDDFAVIYSRLVGVFRSNIPFTIVFPLAIRLLKKIPPEKLDVYLSLSQWSCYKTAGEVTSNWIEEGTELLREAAEEQYRVRDAETHTEITRRENTVIRQELADAAMKQYSKKSEQVKFNEKIQKQMEIAKEQAIREEAVKWREMEERRAIAAAEEKERLLKAKEAYGNGKWFIDMDYGLGYWSIVIGGTAIAVAIVAIMKGYNYI